ncbi:MAG TPA: RagB/SusD family nutrient uptake outer membrane protein [Longimicrobiaceae bacterium]
MHKRSGGRRRVAATLLTLLAAVGFSGCEDFLSTEPRGELTTPNFFTNESHAVQATNATYNMLRAWPVHVFAWIGMTDIVSDDATKGSVPADASFLGDLDDLNFDPGNIAFSTVWEGYYQGIYRANVAIQNIPQVDMDETLKARLIGENQFLRAYFYFFLVRAFGGVPLILEPLVAGEFDQTRATAEEVYNQIEQDLLSAIEVLPEQYGAADVGRATKGAARALLGKVYLFQGEYENAYEQLRQVIDSGVYSLYPTYRQLFTPAGENSSEAVFEVQNTTLEAGGGSSQYAQVQGIRGIPNVGWGFNTPSDDLEASYEPGDPRLQTTILYPWEMLPDDPNRVVYLNPSMPNNRYNQKVYTSPDTPRGSDNSSVNIRRIRYADVLLMAAEAAFRTGREDEARTWLNQVRTRARDGHKNTVGIFVETLAQSIATQVLGRGAGESRAFVRYVNPESDAFDAGVRSFVSACQDPCAEAPVPPVRVTSIDIIETVNGSPVRDADQFLAAVDAVPTGAPVVLTGERIEQAGDGSTTSSDFIVTLTAQPLLPEVTASGDALLQAIWAERRWELAMEQHRWFDIIRQGRAPQIMGALGKTFQEGKHELYPLPATEVQITGLQQNPGY